MIDYTVLLESIAAAVLYGLSGFLKKQPQEPFDAQKILSTVLIGVVVGVIETYLGIDYGPAMMFLVSAGGVVLIENFVKAVWRRVTASKLTFCRYCGRNLA